MRSYIKECTAFICAVTILSACSKTDFTVEAAKARTPAPPPTPALTARQQLGKFIYFDANISESENPLVVKQQACASCHLPSFGFAAPGTGGGVYPVNTLRGFMDGFAEGAVEGVFGGRKPPSSAYASGVTPVMSKPRNAGFRGGLFWDGRATGLRLNNPGAEQALGPFLSVKEHNLPSKEVVLQRIMASDYYAAGLWRNVWGANISLATQADIDLNYDRVGLSIADYESSFEVNQFSSKYDDVKKGLATFTAEEQQGYNLVQLTGAGCVDCHAETNTFNKLPLFTNFEYENLGLPKNPSPFSPAGIDLGLGGFLRTLPANNAWRAEAPANDGKFRTPTLRNVAMNEANRRYMHNGVFKTLEEVVHFYNTRDVPGAGWSQETNSGDPSAPGFKRWDAPEYAATMKTGGEVGDIGLTTQEELAIVAFMRTLTDRRAVAPPTLQ